MEDYEEEKIGFFAKIKSWFKKDKDEDVQAEYKRKLMDRKIERFLDSNFDSFIAEYGLVREIDIARYDERHGILSSKLKVLNDFVKEADADISNLEIRVEHMKKNIKGYKG
ncbi:MAG: hypothetical protein QCI82_07870 [Candidatus Thermoplasmatota archaeon]|nr:hypothetical protein [Candidatus Thermoplasmatota archaeon]